MSWRPRRITLIPLILFAGLTVVISLSGCRGGNERLIAPVSGRVTLDGEPLAGAGVTFQPIAPAGKTLAGRGSFAYCDDDGRFELETVDGTPGAVVSQHQVRIYGPKERQRATDGGGSQREIVPEKYNYQTTLTFVVPRAGTDSADFVLTTSE